MRYTAMRTQEERIAMLHKRAGELERQQDRSRAVCWGSISSCLSVLLISCVVMAERVLHDSAGTQMSGASLLDESAGGYVLAAVIAFFTGVIITAVIFRYRRKEQTRKPGERRML